MAATAHAHLPCSGVVALRCSDIQCGDMGLSRTPNRRFATWFKLGPWAFCWHSTCCAVPSFCHGEEAWQPAPRHPAPTHATCPAIQSPPPAYSDPGADTLNDVRADAAARLRRRVAGSGGHYKADVTVCRLAPLRLLSVAEQCQPAAAASSSSSPTRIPSLALLHRLRSPSPFPSLSAPR